MGVQRASSPRFRGPGHGHSIQQCGAVLSVIPNCHLIPTGASTYEEASEHILKEFTRRKPADKSLYSHFTVATDTKNVEIVFAASMDTILKKTLSTVGVY